MKASVIEKLEELMPQFPEYPQENSVDLLRKRGYLKKDALIYRSDYIKDHLSGERMKVVKVVCSCCGVTSYLEHAPGDDMGCRYAKASFGFIDPADNQIKGSGDCCICPACGKGMKAIHISNFKSIYELDNKCFLTVHNIAGHLAVLEWIANKYVDREGNVRYDVRGYEGVVVVAGSLVRVVKYTKFMSSYSWLSKWEYRKKYSDELFGWDQTELIGWKRSVVEKSNCANSALCEYMRNGDLRSEKAGAFPARYLQTWLLHPNVENLVRQGFSRYVTSVFTNATVVDNYYSSVYKVSQSGLFINWKEVKPLKMLGLDKSECDIAKKCTMDVLLLYRKIRDAKGIKLTAEQLRAIGEDKKYFWAFAAEEVNGFNVPIVRTLNYLIKQREKRKGDLVDARYLLDYWNMLFEVYGSMVESEIYPRDIVTAHDTMVARKQERESAELQEKFNKRLLELEPLCFEDKETGLLIRPCQSQIEMIAEGKALSHCVGGYAKLHANGATSILFIRRIKEPQKPYFTLEYSGGKVIQNRGKSNCARTDEVKIFEEKWLDFIKTKNKKGRKKNGKRNGTAEERERAGA